MGDSQKLTNTWTNKIVAFCPLLNENSRYQGFAVISKDLKFFYSATVKLEKLLETTKDIIVFDKYQLADQLKIDLPTKHNFRSLYFQLNSEIKFQNIFDIVKQECYSTDLDNIHYLIRPEGARKCVIAACFMLEYYLKNYKKVDKNILKIDNSLLEKYSARKSKITIDQVAIRTELSFIQKTKWDLERKLFKKIGYPVWNINSIDDYNQREDQSNINSLEEISNYKNKIEYLERFLNTPKMVLNFDTTATATGRILCRDKEHNLGLFAPDNKYKKLFVCEKDNLFISADYKRQEAFILATVSKDEQLLEDIQNNDFYSRLARWTLRETKKEIGKTLFYAIIYGSTVSSLAESLNISEQKAQESILKIKKRYKSLNKWLINFKEDKNYFGRKLHKNTVNAYIQSTAADIIRQKLLDTFKYNPVLVLADNIIYELPEKDYQNSLQGIRNQLNNTPFKGLYTEPIISHSLEFEEISF